MARQIDWEKLDYLVGLDQQTEHNYIGDGLLIVIDSDERPAVGIVEGQPYHSNWGGIIRVVQGWARFLVHMVSYRLEAGMILVTPEDSIIEMEASSDDYRFQAINFHDMPNSLGFSHACQLMPSDTDWERTERYFDLLLRVVKQTDFSHKTIKALTLALLTDLSHIRETGRMANPLDMASHRETVFSQFLSLVDTYGAQQRRIQFYADRIHLTPNHLGTIVRQQSGQTAAWWFNRATIQQAKVLLRYSDLLNYQIADRLAFPSASAFSGFFKRETGMSPAEYKEKV